MNELSEMAKDAVRVNFNPAGNERVARITQMAAALIDEYDRIRIDKPGAAREASVAITHLQTASMWAVLAATKK
jgi:hypothetical protein